MQEKILFVEDEQTIAMAVSEFLTINGFEVIHAGCGKTAIEIASKLSPDLGILDVMLPDMSGFILAEKLRKLHPNILIIFLTARTSLEDVLQGFGVGGDDYLKKPFSLAELHARVQALLGRSSTGKIKEEVHKFNNFVFDNINQILQNPKGEKFFLSHREAELLNLLITHKNSILSKETALVTIWGDDSYFNSRTMDVFISRLRKYFSSYDSIKIINIRGVGYKFLVS